MVKPIPEGQHSLTAHLTLKNAAKAIEFYKKVFDAQEVSRCCADDGRIMHADIKIGDAHLFISDEFPEYSPKVGPGPNSHAVLHLYVVDTDKQFQKALESGAIAIMPPGDAFWGDRYGQLVDPFGQTWSIATHKEDLSPEEIEKRQKAFFAKAEFSRK